MATIQKVYYNLKESVYSISENGIEYFFSSDFNKKRFVEKVERARKEMKNSFVMKKYPITKEIKDSYDLSSLSDLNLYLIVENKGFCVSYKGAFINCQTLITIILQNAINNCYQKSTIVSGQNKED